MGWPSELVLPHQQILDSLPEAPVGSEDVVSGSIEGNPARSRELCAEATLFIRRAGRDHSAEEGRYRGHSGRQAPLLHPAGAAEFRTGDRDALRRYQG